MKYIFFLFLGLFIGFELAYAQKKQKEKEFILEKELIEGSAKTTDLFYLLKGRVKDVPFLFKMKENFIPEMKKTLNGLNRIERK